jgi:hypothetical protein
MQESMARIEEIESDGIGGLEAAKTAGCTGRRQVRCVDCWKPNCPKGGWITPMSYQPDLPKEDWCEWCMEEERCVKDRKANTKPPPISVDGLSGLGQIFEPLSCVRIDIDVAQQTQ